MKILISIKNMLIRKTIQVARIQILRDRTSIMLADPDHIKFFELGHTVVGIDRATGTLILEPNAEAGQVIITKELSK